MGNKTINNVGLENFLLKKGYHPIKLTKLSTGQIQLNSSINGVQGSFLLDTRASATVIEINRKEKFLISSTRPDENAAGAGGNEIPIQVSSANKLKLVNLEIENQEIYLMPLEHVNNAFVKIGIDEVDGIIGSDVLNNFYGIIDYANLILYLKN